MKTKKNRNDIWANDRKNIFDIYPHLQKVDFNKSLFYEDPSFMAKIINDILKYDSSSSASGRRTPLTLDRARKELNSFIEDDYSIEPFVPTLKKLKGKLSVRKVADLTGLDKSMVMLLLQGKKKPDYDILVKISNAFGKKPEYFLEYRVLFLFSILNERFNNYPESSIVFFEKVK